ncbi:hypothetical protein NDU88_001551 [Pleurodeles waltl]|uniref:DNA-directed DNA polymerase n=1 Tax=Pleurodeles waltl TaxID=8319 RepID=A0AAV7TI58_PLEWA|nr:hypothetical protein NDU88_001551 [Pleurodeles waltl]
MCLAASIAGLMMDRATPDHVIMFMAAEARKALQIWPDRLVGFGDLGHFENHFAIMVNVLYHSGSWKYFTTDELVKNKTVFVLHHENHFFGILNLKGFLGAKVYVGDGWAQPNYIYSHDLTAEENWEFEGRLCVNDFLNTFMQLKYYEYTVLAHNSKAYDSFFILLDLIYEKMAIELITLGSKLMLLKVVPFEIRFIDTLNFLPVKFSKLPKAFGFEGCKGYFPHFFNTLASQNYNGPMPPPDSYGF